MKKKRVIFYCITLLMFCQGTMNTLAISEGQRGGIIDNCETIRDNLRNIQKLDARTRVFFGSHYETILSKFITPLNLRLVENNMSEVDLIDNQNDFAMAKSTFAIDFVIYQQNLEELVGMDCRTEPEKFYEKLILVREKREMMVYDLDKLRGLGLKNIELVQKLKESL